MIDRVHGLRGHGAYGRRLLGFVPSFLIAEFFYKFHSFSLECAAFLVTWFVLDIVIDAVAGAPESKTASIDA